MDSTIITPAAENDLVTIWLHIARDNQDAVDRVYQAAKKMGVISLWCSPAWFKESMACFLGQEPRKTLSKPNQEYRGMSSLNGTNLSIKKNYDKHHRSHETT